MASKLNHNLINLISEEIIQQRVEENIQQRIKEHTDNLYIVTMLYHQPAVINIKDFGNKYADLIPNKSSNSDDLDHIYDILIYYLYLYDRPIKRHFDRWIENYGDISMEKITKEKELEIVKEFINNEYAICLQSLDDYIYR